jgi:hypothetical protein
MSDFVTGLADGTKIGTITVCGQPFECAVTQGEIRVITLESILAWIMASWPDVDRSHIATKNLNACFRNSRIYSIMRRESLSELTPVIVEVSNRMVICYESGLLISSLIAWTKVESVATFRDTCMEMINHLVINGLTPMIDTATNHRRRPGELLEEFVEVMQRVHQMEFESN